MAETKVSANRESILYGIIGFLLGIVLTVLFIRSSVDNSMNGMMRMMGVRQNQEMMDNRNEMMKHEEGMGMDEMTEALKSKSGDDFDKEFTRLMIEHHQGAIDMANLAEVNAKHKEIKDLATNIISAQAAEINMMKEWIKNWGY